MSDSDSPSPRHVPVKFRRKGSHTPLHDLVYSQTPPWSFMRPSSIPFYTPRNQGTSHTGEGMMAVGAMKKSVLASARVHLHHWPRNTHRDSATMTTYTPPDEDLFMIPPSDDTLTSPDYSSENDSAMDDQHEEHDLESMDIHLRESYFEISAERGRWKSSPIIPRIRTKMFASSPTKGCSAPPEVFNLQTRARRQSTNSLACTEISTSSFGLNGEERDESRFSSPLPSSSPPTSPVSFAFSLLDDCPVVDDQTPSSPLSIQPLHNQSPSSDDRVSRDKSRVLSPDPMSGMNTSFYGHNAQHLLEPVFSPCPAKRIFDSPCSHSPEQDTKRSSASFDTKEPSSFLPLTGSDVVAATKNDVFCSSIIAYNPVSPLLTSEIDHQSRRGASTSPLRSNAKFTRANSEEDKSREESSPSERPKKKCKTTDSSYGSKETRGGCRARKHAGKPQMKERSPETKSLGDERTEANSTCLTRSEPRAPSQSQPCARTSSTGACSIPHSGNESSMNEHAELTGMLVEALATARATSMDTAALYLMLTRAHPKLKTEQPKKTLLKHIAEALEAGRVRCGMFERVQSSGEVACEDGGDEGSSHGRWFYVAERDEDKERAVLIGALAPRQKRSETKKYKQYYWKPLDRISRWDAEDAL